MPDGLDRLVSEETLDQLFEGSTPDGLRRLMGIAWNKPASLLDYIPANSFIAIDEKRHGSAHGKLWLQHAEEHHIDVGQSMGLSIDEQKKYWPPLLHRSIEESYANTDGFAGIDLAQLHEDDGYANSFDLASRPIPANPNQFGRLGEQIKN